MDCLPDFLPARDERDWMVDETLPKKLELPGFPYALRMDEECLVAILERADPSGLPPPEVAVTELVAAIQHLGILEVDAAGLERTLPQVRMGKRFCVARGLSPEHGHDGYIKYHFEPRIAEKVWQEDESIKVNFRERNEINNVYEGDVLAEQVPPSVALDGRNVLGHPIRAQRGKAVRLLAGKNVVLSPDGARAFSKINGSAKEVGNRISVDAVQTSQGDLDFKSGNVDFAGDVVVFGTVKETFKIEAGGSIRVGQAVDRADLKAAGDIVIEGGLYGKEGVTVEAAGDVSFAFAENAVIKAGGNIYVRGAMINCQAHAAGKIYLKAVGRALVGGHIIANQGVESHSVGNPRLPIETTIEFGLRPEMSRHLRQLETEFARVDTYRQEAIRQEMEELLRQNEGLLRAKVVVRGSVYPGVILVSDKVVYEVRSEMTNRVFYKPKLADKISLREYDPKRD